MKPSDKNKTLSGEEIFRIIDANDEREMESFDEFEKDAAEGLKMVRDRERLNRIHERIDEELQEKKKRRGVIFWMSAAASLVFVVGLIWLIMPVVNNKAEVASAENSAKELPLVNSDGKLDSVVKVEEYNLETDSSPKNLGWYSSSGKGPVVANNEVVTEVRAEDKVTQEGEQLEKANKDLTITEKKKLESSDNPAKLNDTKLVFKKSEEERSTVVNGTVNPGTYTWTDNNNQGNATVNTNTGTNMSNASSNYFNGNQSGLLYESNKTFVQPLKPSTTKKDELAAGKKGENFRLKTPAKTGGKGDTTIAAGYVGIKQADDMSGNDELKVNENRVDNVVNTSTPVMVNSNGTGTNSTADGSTVSLVIQKKEEDKKKASKDVADKKITEQPKTINQTAQTVTKNQTTTETLNKQVFAESQKLDFETKSPALAMDSAASSQYMGEIVLAKEKEKENTNYKFVTPGMPEFPGGFAAMQKFFRDNIKRPAADKNPGGQIVVSFAIGVDGSVSDIKEIKNISGCPDCMKEVKRVIMLMPKWKPGTTAGKPIAMRYNLPVRF
jgi:hypothetical protein